MGFICKDMRSNAMLWEMEKSNDMLCYRLLCYVMRFEQISSVKRGVSKILKKKLKTSLIPKDY